MMKKLNKQLKTNLNTVHAYDECYPCMGSAECTIACSQGVYTYTRGYGYYIYAYKRDYLGGGK